MPLHIKKYSDWIKAKFNLSQFKKEELLLRNEIINDFTTQTPEHKIEGIESETLENFKLKYKFGLNRNIDRAELDTVWKKLSEEEKGCIDWKPSLKLKEYKALEKSNPDSVLLGCIIEKPAQSNLEIVDLNYE